ncbi:putative ABC transport system permease protein [bacterium A37T11]|nr:putative ABC transport system permease protein [bacterium A37T11]
MSTARALERAKEVGLGKVVGAYRNQIMRQFLSESILICLLSFVIAILLCWLIIPYFNDIVGKQISAGLFHEPIYIGILFLLSICFGLLAGIYPAVVLSSFNPVTVLKGKFSSNAKGQFLRKSLVIIQFVVSIALIAGTMIVSSQLGFMRDQDLGYSKDQMLVLQTDGDAKSELLKEALTNLPGVLSSSQSSSVPGGGNAIAYSELENNKGDL